MLPTLVCVTCIAVASDADSVFAGHAAQPGADAHGRGPHRGLQENELACRTGARACAESAALRVSLRDRVVLSGLTGSEMRDRGLGDRR
eukprot:198498-Rhodomonas_salina.1